MSEDPFGRSSKTQKQTLAQMQRILTLSAKQSLVLGLKMSATAVGGAKQNPIQMNSPPQLSRSKSHGKQGQPPFKRVHGPRAEA